MYPLLMILDWSLENTFQHTALILMIQLQRKTANVSTSDSIMQALQVLSLLPVCEGYITTANIFCNFIIRVQSFNYINIIII